MTSSIWSNINCFNITTSMAFFDRKNSKVIALLHQKQTVTCRDVIDAKRQKGARKDGKRTSHTAAQHQLWRNVAVTLKKQLKANDVSIGKENCTSFFYGDTVITYGKGIQETSVTSICHHRTRSKSLHDMCTRIRGFIFWSLLPLSLL